MITELSIRNFAIIDDISIHFQDGLTVLTGETGAGKSIIIDAVQLLTGERGSVDFVKHGEKKAEISGLFYADKVAQQLSLKCETYGIELEDGMIILERAITNQGKSICRINGKMVTLAILREFGRALVNIHSQHDNIQLMDSKNHLSLIDLYYSQKINPVKERYTHLFEQKAALKRQYDRLTASEQETAQRIDLLQFQLSELEEANLQIDEDEQLNKERNQLHHFEKIHRTVHDGYYALYGEQKALEWLDIAQNNLHEASTIDDNMTKYAQELTNAYYQIEEISFALRDYTDSLHFDEARLNEIEMRLNDINRLKKKYGKTVKDMIQYKKNIEQELDALKHKDSHMTQLQSDMENIDAKAKKAANTLHQLRKEAARTLEKNIMTELKDLYLENTVFSIEFNKTALHAQGIDEIRFMLSANKGEPLKELSKTASGGELSRIMLALKKTFAKHDAIDTVIFDEVDTGVSGRVAQAIAEKMYEISQSTQVLGISHLPQVAAMSDQHILIQKNETDSRAITTMKELEEHEKIKELGKMITGTKLTATATKHAEELLSLTKSFKTKQHHSSAMN